MSKNIEKSCPQNNIKMKTFCVFVERYSEEKIRNHIVVEALDEEDAQKRVEQLYETTEEPWYEPMKYGGLDDWRDKHWDSDYYTLRVSSPLEPSQVGKRLSDAKYKQMLKDEEGES